MSQDKRGFTLIEILVSMLIISVVIVAIWTLFVLSMKVNASAGDQTECTTLAQQQMERLKDAEYDSLVNGGSIETPVPGYSEYFDSNGDNRRDFVVSWVIDHETATSSAKALSSKKIGMMELSVKCESLRAQSAGSGKPKQVVFSTIKTKGMQ